NEPPIVNYRIPIIGHTLRFIYDCEKLVVESREKYGEIYSLYIFGELITVVGKDTIGDYTEEKMTLNFIWQLVVKYIFDDAFKDLNKSLKFMKDFFKANLNNFMDKIEQNVIKGIDIYIGEYIDRFIKEAFRLNADLLGLPRQCVTDTYYTFSNGYQIPSGRMVSVDVLELYRNENFQGPNLNEFNASRHNSPATKLDLPRNHIGFFIAPAKPDDSSIIFENSKDLPTQPLYRFFIAPAKPGDSSIIFENSN
ncbi:19434_t:CDS:2, partial [Gigaspora margarita]